jgi:hypothetical protein
MVVYRASAAAIGLAALLVSSLTAAPSFSDWFEPVNLGSAVNSSANDATPAVSKNGRSLYFSSNRKGAAFGPDIYVSRWDDLTGDWGAPVEIAQLNSRVIDTGPTLSRDEHWLFFTSNRNGTMDIWASFREHVHDDEGWETPVPLDPPVNSSSEDLVGGFFENGETGAPQIFFSSNRPIGMPMFGLDFYVSEMQPDGHFGPATRIAELSAPFADPGMMVTFDGLEAFFYSTRLGGAAEIFTATRETVLSAWSAPRNVAELNSPWVDQRPYIAADRRTLYFASDRPDASASGGLDLYVATRARQQR